MNDVQTRNISIQNKNKVCEFNKNFSDKYVLLLHSMIIFIEEIIFQLTILYNNFNVG